MREAWMISGKHNNTSGADVKVNNMVPLEDTYQVELFQLLRSALPASFSAHVGMNGPNTPRAGIAASNSKNEHVVVEVVAHECDGPVTRHGSVLEHLDRCANMYTKINGVRETWVSSPLSFLYHSQTYTNYSFAGHQFHHKAAK